MASSNNANLGFENRFGTQRVSFGDIFPQQNIERLS